MIPTAQTAEDYVHLKPIKRIPTRRHFKPPSPRAAKKAPNAQKGSPVNVPTFGVALGFALLLFTTASAWAGWGRNDTTAARKNALDCACLGRDFRCHGWIRCGIGVQRVHSRHDRDRYLLYTPACGGRSFGCFVSLMVLSAKCDALITPPKPLLRRFSQAVCGLV